MFRAVIVDDCLDCCHISFHLVDQHQWILPRLKHKAAETSVPLSSFSHGSLDMHTQA
jgi:hypothetical protein